MWVIIWMTSDLSPSQSRTDSRSGGGRKTKMGGKARLSRTGSVSVSTHTHLPVTVHMHHIRALRCLLRRSSRGSLAGKGEWRTLWCGGWYDDGLLRPQSQEAAGS